MLPTMGLLEPRQTCRIKVTIQPLMAVIYQVQATCWYGDNSKQKSNIQLQATGEADLSLVPRACPLHVPSLKASVCPPTFVPGLPSPRTPSRFLPSPKPHRFCLLFTLFGVKDECFPGDTYLLRGAVHI